MATSYIVKIIIWCLNLAMVNKVQHIDVEDKYGYIKSSETVKSRLDLNDLLQRAKEEKKSDIKTNVLILSGAFLIVLVVFLMLSL